MNQKKVPEIKDLTNFLELDNQPIPSKQHPINKYEANLEQTKQERHNQLLQENPQTTSLNSSYTLEQQKIQLELEELKQQFNRQKKTKKAYHFYFEVDLYNQLAFLASELDRSNTSLLAEAVKDILLKYKKGTN